MSSEDVTTDSVQLHYVLTPDDLFDGVAAQLRRFPIPWYLRWLPTLLAVCVAAVLFLYDALFKPTANLTADAITFVVVVFVVFGVNLVKGRRRSLPGFARLVFRAQMRQIVRGNPKLSEPMRTTITDTGVRLSGAASEITASWDQYPVHTETDQSFVLFASQRRGAAQVVLPKRGLAGADPAPLRALIAAHSRRLA